MPSISTNWILSGDITIYESKKETNGKLLSWLIKDYYLNPKSYISDYATHQEYFRG